VAATAALALALVCGAVGAQSLLSRQDAETRALQLVPGGAIVGGNLERQKDRLLWLFDVSIPGSKNVRAIQVDAYSGAVVSNLLESPVDR
jgi:uncharacterized membrane protein YkoI